MEKSKDTTRTKPKEQLCEGEREGVMKLASFISPPPPPPPVLFFLLLVASLKIIVVPAALRLPTTTTRTPFCSANTSRHDSAATVVVLVVVDAAVAAVGGARAESTALASAIMTRIASSWKPSLIRSDGDTRPPFRRPKDLCEIVKLRRCHCLLGERNEAGGDGVVQRDVTSVLLSLLFLGYPILTTNVT